MKDRFGKVRKILPSLILKNPLYKRSAESLVSGYLSYLLYSLIFPLLVPLWFFWQGRKKGASKLLRGAVLESSKVVKALVSKYNDKILERSIWKIKTLLRLLKSKILKTEFKEINYKPYIISNDIEYPAYTEFQHTFITGGSGTGKTVFLSSLISQIKENGDIAIIYDKRGSFIPYFYITGKDIILNPYDVRGESWSIYQF